MSDERPPRPPRHPRVLGDDEVVVVPPEPPRLNREPFRKLVQTNAETIAEVLSVQRKMSLQMDGFGQAMNRRFDIFHEELALQRATIDNVEKLVKQGHGPRLDKVEATLGQKVAKGGGIVGIVIVVLPLLSEVLPKWASVFERIGALLQ